MKKEKGIIQLAIIIVLSIIILSLLGVSISSLFNSKTLRENFATLWRGISWLWNTYASVIWEFIKSWLYEPLKTIFS